MGRVLGPTLQPAMGNGFKWVTRRTHWVPEWVTNNANIRQPLDCITYAFFLYNSLYFTYSSLASQQLVIVIRS